MQYYSPFLYYYRQLLAFMMSRLHFDCASTRTSREISILNCIEGLDQTHVSIVIQQVELLSYKSFNFSMYMNYYAKN